MASITIRAGGYAPQATTHSRALDRFKAAMHDRLGDEVEVELLYNVMDDGRPATALFDLLEAGELTWCYFSTSYLSHPLADAIEVPFLFDDLASAHAALDGPFGAMIGQAVLRDRGMELLGFWDNGFRHLTNALRPVVSPDDCAGMRIRIQPNPTHADMMRSWGMEPVMAELSEGIRLIRNAEVDAQENPLANTVAYGVAHRYVTKTAHLYGARGIFAKPGTLASLPAEVAAAVRIAVRSAIDFQRLAAAEHEAELEDQLVAEGRRFDTPSVEQHAVFRDAAAEVVDRAIGAIDDNLLALLPVT